MDDTKTLQENADLLNTKLAQSGMGITAGVSGSNLVFTAANQAAPEPSR